MADMISVATGFQSSVNIAYDINDEAKLKNYIPTKSALKLLEDILLSTGKESTDRARILIGAYGKGKSHIVLMILSILMKKDITLFEKLIPVIEKEKPELYQLIKNYYAGKGKILPVVISGSSNSLAQAFLLALQRTLAENELNDIMPETNYQAAVNTIQRWKGDFPDTYEQFKGLLTDDVEEFVGRLTDFDPSAYEEFEKLYPSLTAGSSFNPFIGFDVADLYEEVVKALKPKGYSGIYAIYDEFSKYLENHIADAIGSILLLTSSADEYCSKIIGRNADLNTSDITGDVDFLLDGQQRITVLTNVFSNVIHDKCPRVSELVSPSLKRRFFLKIPKWIDVHNGKEADLFGIQTLAFPLANPDVDIPEFLSGEILSFIETQTFNANDNKPYNPHNNLSTDLDQFCTSFSNGYLIPLYLLIQTGRKKSQMQLRFKDIMTRISEYIKSEMYDYFTSLPSDAEQRAFVKKVMHDDPDECTELLDKVTYVDEFETVLDNRKDIWVDSMKIYLDSCVKTVYLSQIRVSASQRGRAIDIYENLNMGGVSLNTFDLIMARVAKVDKKNFLQRIKESIESTKTYPNSVLESSIKTILSSALTNKTYNATLKTNCINKGELNPRYIDAFLDVLCLYCNNPSFDPDKYKVDFIKKDKILNLVPEEINDNCEKVINALDRALFFFQTRCGIRTIGEINYNLMLVLVGTLFMEDSYFYNYEVHRLLEAWYWSVVFSGEYDKDQNSHMISNLQNIVRCVSGTNRDLTWLNSISANVLKMTNFSDKDLLLMNKVNEDRYPKPVLRNFMCQYLLSGTYMDMFDETKKISVFCEDADTLEAHHIIPLGSAKKVGEITADIRKNPRHICNSPLNFVYITKAANKDISDDALDAYEKKIQPAAKAALFISSYTPASHDTEIKVRGLLESRYSMMQGTISGEINDLLTNWM